jgi:hypothetical protein
VLEDESQAVTWQTCAFKCNIRVSNLTSSTANNIVVFLGSCRLIPVKLIACVYLQGVQLKSGPLTKP